MSYSLLFRGPITGISAISVDDESDEICNVEMIPPPSPYRNKPHPLTQPQQPVQQVNVNTEHNGYTHDTTDYNSAVTHNIHNYSNHIQQTTEPLYSQPYQTWRNQQHFHNQQHPRQQQEKYGIKTAVDDDGYRIVRVCKNNFKML